MVQEKRKLTTAQAENIKTWVSALRSGRYQQGVGALCVEGATGWRYCCLGVACDISGLGAWTGGDNDERRFDTGPDYSSYDLPAELRDWLGMPAEGCETPAYIEGVTDAASEDDKDGSERCTGLVNLVSANDEERETFDQIADRIEWWVANCCQVVP